MRRSRIAILILASFVSYAVLASFGQLKMMTAKNTGVHDPILSLLSVEAEAVSPTASDTPTEQAGIRITKLQAQGLIPSQTRIQPNFIIEVVDGEKIVDLAHFTQLLNEKKGKVQLEGRYDDLTAYHDDLPGLYVYEINIEQEIES